MGALPGRSDLVLSLGFAALALVEVALTPAMGLSVAERSGESAGAVLVAGCFLFRRQHPVASALLVLLLLSGVSVAWTDSSLWVIAAVMLASYSCARYAAWTGAWVALAAATGFAVLSTSLEEN